MSPSVPAAAVPDPAGDNARGPGHHPAHVHPVHQPELGHPGHTGDRGLSRDLGTVPKSSPEPLPDPPGPSNTPGTEPVEGSAISTSLCWPWELSRISRISSRLCQECNIFIFQTNLCVSSCFSKPWEKRSEGIWSISLNKRGKCFYF